MGAEQLLWCLAAMLAIGGPWLARGRYARQRAEQRRAHRRARRLEHERQWREMIAHSRAGA